MLFMIDVNYINFSWGYVNKGTLILPNGNILTYNLERAIENTIENKLSQSVIVGSITEDAINVIYKLIGESVDGELVDEGSVRYDSGGKSYKVYLYNQEIPNVLTLRIDGHRSEYNNAQSAITLVDMLKNIVQQCKMCDQYHVKGKN